MRQVISEQAPRPVCGCGEPVEKGKVNRLGIQLWRTGCKACNDKPWAKYRKHVCERCEFIPEARCQLDVHHIDNDKTNNTADNLQTLCANCHRLVHHQDRKKAQAVAA
jgi:predicted HNH restriction endonuclease